MCDFLKTTFEVNLAALSISLVTIEEGEENLNEYTRLVLYKEPSNFSRSVKYAIYFFNVF